MDRKDFPIKPDLILLTTRYLSKKVICIQVLAAIQLIVEQYSLNCYLVDMLKCFIIFSRINSSGCTFLKIFITLIKKIMFIGKGLLTYKSLDPQQYCTLRKKFSK